MTSEELKKQNMERALQSMYDLCLQHGIDNTTKEMVARASKISRATVDRYFINKSEGVIQMAEWLGNKLHTQNRHLETELASGKHTGAEMLIRYMDVVKDLFYKDPNLFVFVTELKPYIYRNCPETVPAFRRLADVFGHRSALNKIFLCGIKDGSLEPDLDPEKETDYLTEFYCGYLSKLALLPNPTAKENQPRVDDLIQRSTRHYLIRKEPISTVQ